MKCNDRNMTTRFSLMTKLLVLIKGNEIKDFCEYFLMESAVAWDTFGGILIFFVKGFLDLGWKMVMISSYSD